jgi:GNAT superfamily N-acetyltransferase
MAVFFGLYTLAMSFEVRVATLADVPGIRSLIASSVRKLQVEYTDVEREAALRTVFTVDSRLLEDGTYFVALCGGRLAGCGGWSYRKTLYGGDHQVEKSDEGFLDVRRDAAKIRAIFVHPEFARMGLGSLLLQYGEEAAWRAGFRRAEMGSTLAGLALYSLKGYCAVGTSNVPVGDGVAITIVRMEKHLGSGLPDLEGEDQAVSS